MSQSLEELEVLSKLNSTSSVEAERCFVAAGLFILKLRSLLRDKKIDYLCLVHSYFVRK